MSVANCLILAFVLSSFVAPTMDSESAQPLSTDAIEQSVLQAVNLRTAAVPEGWTAPVESMGVAGGT